MQALRDHSGSSGRRGPSTRLVIGALAALVAVAAIAGGVVYVIDSGSSTPAVSCAKGVSCVASPHGGGGQASDAAAKTFSIKSTTPSTGQTGVASDTSVTVAFSTKVDAGGTLPSLSPTVSGSWAADSSGTELVFTPSAPFVPYKKYTLTVPGGSSGVRSATGAQLAKGDKVSFTIATGSTLRLQQLLAVLGYLPLAYDGSTPAPQDMALPQPGTLTWRWATLPTQLTGQWSAGSPNDITKGAVMMFETENGLTIDGVAGPDVWTALLSDVVAHRDNTEPVTYVLVTKTLPEHVTAWVNGVLAYQIPCNTGVPGATTTDGTFEVFEHVKASDMKGTNVTGSTYTDPTVPWASYFDGGEALHGYPRATYGWPQSNGCVEMPISTAGDLWPYTPIGTLVTVQGPTAK